MILNIEEVKNIICLNCKQHINRYDSNFYCYYTCSKIKICNYLNYSSIFIKYSFGEINFSLLFETEIISPEKYFDKNEFIIDEIFISDYYSDSKNNIISLLRLYLLNNKNNFTSINDLYSESIRVYKSYKDNLIFI
jgi:hypothetical protein